MKIGQSPEGITRFYLAHDISALPVGTRFIKNPPHVTQTPPALVERARMPEVEAFLEEVSAQTDAIALRSMGLMFVGHRNDPTLATRFERTPELDQLHRTLVHGLGKLGCDFPDLCFALDKYKPHTEAILLDEEERLIMGNISIHAKRPHPNISGLTELTSRHDLRTI
jgi:hypothetical protein